MAVLDMEGVGDVEEECYRSLRPGSRVFLWYSDDNVWHENMVAFVVGGEEVVLWTPDDDLYIEKVGCKGVEGPVKLRGLNSRGKVPRFSMPVYRFKAAITDDDIRRVVRAGYSLVRDEGLTPKVPKEVVNARSEIVDIDEFFGGHFIKRRLTRKGAAEADGPGPAKMESPKNALKVQPAGADSVWLCAEPIGGLCLGQEVSLNQDSDVQVGDRTALALKNGKWVKVELVLLADADRYAESRRRLFVQTSPDVTSQPEKSKKSSPADADADEQGNGEHGDVRTLWVDFDEHGERFKRWRDVCAESFAPAFETKPLDGPCTALHLIKHCERQGGDPRLWLQLWLRSKHIESGDRTWHETKVLADVLFYAGTFDQVNIPGLICLEVVCRRLQAIVDAYTNPHKPSWDNAKIFTGQGSPEDIVSPTFRTYAVKKNREELELLQARQKVRELRGAPLTGTDDSGDVTSALPKKPAKAKKGKGRGDDGQQDG
eukprot:s90_g32.t1